MTKYSKNPGGVNLLDEDVLLHIRTSVGEDPAKLFRAGFNTREIAQLVGLAEHDVWNAQKYKRQTDVV